VTGETTPIDICNVGPTTTTAKPNGDVVTDDGSDDDNNTSAKPNGDVVTDDGSDDDNNTSAKPNGDVVTDDGSDDDNLTSAIVITTQVPTTTTSSYDYCHEDTHIWSDWYKTSK